MEDYLAEFESLLRKVSNVGDNTLTSLFIVGLASSLKYELLTRRPSYVTTPSRLLSSCWPAAPPPPSPLSPTVGLSGSDGIYAVLLHRPPPDPNCLRARNLLPFSQQREDARSSAYLRPREPTRQPGTFIGTARKNTVGSMFARRSSTPSWVRTMRTKSPPTLFTAT